MANLKSLTTYQWPTDDFPLAQIGIRLADLAARHSLPVQQWEEDGLGAADGVLCQVSSGFIFLLQELRHAIEHLGDKGPTVYVDAEELGKLGIENLLDQLLNALQISRSDLTWIQDPKSQKDAKERGRSARDYKKRV